LTSVSNDDMYATVRAVVGGFRRRQ